MLNSFMELDKEHATKNVYLWTILSGLLYSGSTFLLTIIATQCINSFYGGIYTIALTIANQLITIGYFNTRTYQASDIYEKTSFNDYFTLKLYTTFMMIVICIGWVILGGFNLEKSICVLLMTIFKCIEVFGDVFEGRYQQKDRFDIASKSLFLRTMTFIISFIVCAIITHNLTISLAVMTLCYALCFIIVDVRLIKHFGGVAVSKNFMKQKDLVIACFPLFVNSFLLMYINNASKYAIDSYGGEELLVRFNALFMIAFVINMFSTVILKPIINKLSVLYNERKFKGIYKILVRQSLLIVGLTICCLVGAYLLGTQVLSIVYGFDLTSFKLELCIMLIGGSCTAMYQVFQNIIIVMRHQIVCLVGCIITSIITVIITPLFVSHMQIMGGAVSYLCSMLTMSIIYGIFMFYFLIKESRESYER